MDDYILWYLAIGFVVVLIDLLDSDIEEDDPLVNTVAFIIAMITWPIVLYYILRDWSRR